MEKGPALAPLGLSERQKSLLKGRYAQRNAPSWQRFRIAIILGAAQGQSNSALSRDLKVKRDDIRRWRQRWLACYEKLCLFEQGKDGQGISDRELLHKMLSILKDARRPGKPKTITLEQEQQLAALACRKPSEHSIPVTHWTHELLAMVAEEQGIIEKISPRYVGVILKKERAPTA